MLVCDCFFSFFLSAFRVRFARAMGSADLGVVDFNAANAVVEATHRHKEIFYDEQ